MLDATRAPLNCCGVHKIEGRDILEEAVAYAPAKEPLRGHPNNQDRDKTFDAVSSILIDSAIAGAIVGSHADA